MEQKTWKFDLDDTEREVRLDWTYWGGHREVFLDGVSRHESVIPMRGRSQQRFEIDGHPAIVRTEPENFVKFKITLEVDGRLVEAEAVTKPYWEA